MAAESRKEVYCPKCERESWMVKRPQYDGFRKIGETRHCFFCGHEFPEDDTEIEFAEKKELNVFDREEARKVCRHCRHFVVNPFTQKCAIHRREVMALDSCDKFEARREEPDT
jgi:hypothetical protein